ncbi:erythroblast NAD(P)(+)--arginine ADP-ribosyltransferase-like [Hemicordylus capensis]|uniref:erythroblast NAD(P)(+)--arginine ADP-ribosyltransferase-like n=1 Tax=Hemicordylus capensis TaxID=884348 RepID=UPI00230337FF|nr:erythroblast NAD(P)(+)--arginine ADP-ribosyltransferase-like [Hemicordylus capensis]
MRTPPAHLAVLLHLMGIFIRDPQVSCFTEISLDMAPNSVDDQYEGCADGARLEDPIYTDFANNETYAKIWQDAKSNLSHMAHPSLPSDFKPEYGIAILTYTDNQVYEVFNEAVRNGGQSQQYYYSNFTFKSFHFLLTRALQVLKKTTKPECYTVYRGVRDIRFTVSKSQKIVRLGQFSSSSLTRKSALRFGNDTFFTIYTCLGVSIENLSLHPEQEEILIPPYETFTVINSTEKFIALHHKGSHSNFNCGCKSAAAGLSRFSATLPTPVLVGGFLLLAGALGSPSIF